jgi:hypothetical protein
MATYTLTINEKTPKGKSLINLIKAMDEVVTIVSEDTIQEQSSPYNPEFVKEIQKSRKSEGKVIKTEDLWK